MAPGAPGSFPPNRDEARSPRAAGRVLLVDDAEVGRIVGADLLEQLGYEVDVAEDGATAVRLAAGRGYVAILMDCSMPGMDGFEASRLIGTLPSPGRRTPIVALTAYGEADRQRCAAAGMVGFLTKPLDPEVLRATLQGLRAGSTLGQDGDSRDQAGSGPLAAEAPAGSLDPGFLEQLRRLDGSPRALVGRAIALFADGAPQEVEQLDRAVNAGDDETVVQVAHGLRGSAAVVGATALAKLCGVLEGCARTGDFPAAIEVLGLLRAELAEVLASLRAAQQ
jgi:CheY-like chemotaxis protein